MRLAALAWMATLVAIPSGSVASFAATDCPQDTIGLGPAFGNRACGATIGEACGQTFTAHDTLLTFLRVWRVAFQDSGWYIGMHPYIVETDSTGFPKKESIVWEGPTLIIPDGDGINPIEFKWSLDPPLALPHPGKYAFFLFQDPCTYFWDILSTDHPELYSDGDLYASGRSSCRLNNLVTFRGPYREYDLVFEIGFCRDIVTPTRRSSWGELKLLYR